MRRRAFIAGAVLAAGAAPCAALAAAESAKTLPKWKRGEFQVHFIHTGVGEANFLIYPDGTTMLVDCGDHAAGLHGEKPVEIVPNYFRHAGEWVARYVLRVNPHGRDVDYMLLSHHHADHGGTERWYAGRKTVDGVEHFLSGFQQAAEFLDFRKAFDRCWPDFADPIPLVDDKLMARTHMEKFYRYMTRHRGLVVEKVIVGAKNQTGMRREADTFGDFSVVNVCSSGRILRRDGTVRDLYADYIPRFKPVKINENGLSVGQVFRYGRFSLFMAGDFADRWKLPDGTTFEIEDALAAELDAVSVAKINHHGTVSMTPALVKALDAKAWVSVTWGHQNNLDFVMERMAGRGVLCPAVVPPERQQGQDWLKFTAPAALHGGGHVVVTVPPGGETFRLDYVDAHDESMRLLSSDTFVS